MPAPTSSVAASGQKDNNLDGESNVRFNDPLKIREVASHRVDEIVINSDILRLENFLVLDKLGNTSPESLGALLSLFPAEVQKEIFSFSNGKHWMEAYHAA